MVVLGIIYLVGGGSGGWPGILVGLVSLFPYLQYIVRPRLKDMSHNPWRAFAILIPVVILPW